MERNSILYQQYVSILKEELRPAMGCTEPIALAYAGALACDLLGAVPERVLVAVSGNIIKNVKSVVVPNTGGLRGIAAAVCAGIIAGDPDKEHAYSAGHAEGILLFFCKKMPDRQAGKSASRDACSVDECTNACHFQSLLSSAFLFMPFYVCLSHRVCTA
jgi:hypothetical protein